MNALSQSRTETLTSRLGQSVTVKLSGPPTPFDIETCTWIAITSSRLGHNHQLHRQVCRFVGLSLMECRRRNAVLLVAAGSAIEPWAVRAAELFQVPVVLVRVGLENNDDSIKHDLPLLEVSVIDSDSDQSLSRDEVVIALADRVDVVYARRDGNICSCIQDRLQTVQDGSTRVALAGFPKCAGKDLIAKGAVGWIASDQPTADTNQAARSDEAQPIQTGESDWIHQEGEWLFHCTRACQGPWPGETEHQYRDALLLGDDDLKRRPIDTLRRIIRSGKLIASAITTAKSWPVVCFSDAPLADLLLSRCYRPHLKRWDYEPFGVAIRKQSALKLGFQPVIYGQSDDRKSIDESDQFRFQSVGKTYDWTAEKEWRTNRDVDLKGLAMDDVRIFVATDADALEISAISPWETHVVLQAAPMET